MTEILAVLGGFLGITLLILRDYYDHHDDVPTQQIRKEIADGDVDSVSKRVDRLCSTSDHPTDLGSEEDVQRRIYNL